MWKLGSKGVSAILFGAWVAASGGAEEARAAPDLEQHGGFLAAMEHRLAGSGRFEAANPAWKPDGDPNAQPTHWTIDHTFRVAKTVVVYEIGGRFADGRRANYWVGIAQWRPKEATIAIEQFGWSGGRVSGHEETGADGIRRAHLSGPMPDGSTLTFRDELAVTGPDEFRTTSFHLEGGAWVKKNELVWRRVANPAG